MAFLTTSLTLLTVRTAPTPPLERRETLPSILLIQTPLAQEDTLVNYSAESINPLMSYPSRTAGRSMIYHLRIKNGNAMNT